MTLLQKTPTASQPAGNAAVLPFDTNPSSASHALDRGDARSLLRWSAARFGDSLRVVTSFQAEGSVILDLFHRLELRPKVITIDTGRLPEETLELIERLRERYDLDLEILFPNGDALRELMRGSGPNGFLRSVDDRIDCCRVRKVEPLRKALEDAGAWISGLRRQQSGTRSMIRGIEEDRLHRPAGGLFKIHPLADWSSDDVWSYIRSHDLPYHPLYDRGYRSIGCAPCSRPARPGEDERSSRWWWESGAKECGLHLDPALSSAPVKLERSASGRAS